MKKMSVHPFPFNLAQAILPEGIHALVVYVQRLLEAVEALLEREKLV